MQYEQSEQSIYTDQVLYK